MSASYTFTRFTSPDPLSKRYTLREDGTVNKQPAAQMWRGSAERVKTSWEGFFDALKAADCNTAFSYGQFAEAHGTSASVVTKKQGAKAGEVTRSRKEFSFGVTPGVLFLDYDPKPGRERLTVDGLLDILETIMPGIKAAPRIWRASVSSGVEGAGSSGGFHLYIGVADASLIQTAGEALFERLWLAGHGYVRPTKSGALAKYSPIDGSVFQPERLDFAGKPVLGKGVVWTDVAGEMRNADAEPYDLSQVQVLSLKEKRLYAAIVARHKEVAQPNADAIHALWAEPRVKERMAAGVPEAAARTQVRRLGTGESSTLPHEMVLHFAYAGDATVAEVLENLGKYDGEPLADPLEGPEYGASTAIFYANLGGEYAHGPMINSFAHGGARYTLLSKTAEAELAAEAARPVIHLDGGVLHDVVRQMAAVLSQRPIYRSGGGLARVLRLPEDCEISPGVTASAGTLTFVDVTPGYITVEATRGATFLRGEGKKEVAVDCPLTQASAFLDMQEEHEVFLHVRHIQPCPLFTLDGRLLTENGPDEKTALYVEYSGPEIEWPEGMKEAKSWLEGALDEYRFETAADLSVAVSLLVSSVSLHAVPTVPMHTFDSPVRGSGKTKLASLGCVLAAGTKPVSVNHGGDDVEFEKRFNAAAFTGCHGMNLDNVERAIAGDFLKTYLSEPAGKGRMLSRSEMRTLRRMIVTATGNNAVVDDDLNRRNLTCRINPGVERPEDLVFRKEPVAWMQDNRGRVLGAVLWLLREHWLAGRPRPKGKESLLGSFEHWDTLVRGALMWAGYADPLDNRERSESTDPTLERCRELLHSWKAAELPEITCGDLKVLLRGETPRGMSKGPEPLAMADLESALDNLCGRRASKMTADRISAAISVFTDRVVDGLALRMRYDNHKKSKKWRVEAVA